MTKRIITAIPNKLSGKIHLFPLVAVYLLFIAAATGITYYISTVIQKDLVDTVALQLEKVALINEQLHAIHSRHLLIRDILLEEDPFIKDEYMALHADYARRVLKARRALQQLPLTAEEKALINHQWSDSRTGYGVQSDMIEKSLDADHDTRMEIYRELVTSTQTEFLRRMNELAAYRNNLRSVSNRILEEAENNQLESWILIITLYLMTITGGAAAIFWFYLRQREHQQTLDWQATHDSLTGLPNRHEFEQRLHSALDEYKATHIHCVVLHLDMDQFKLINDSSGHAAGDELLKRLGNKLQQSVRAGDLVARLGSDEFGILLHGCDTTHANTIANNICTQIEQHSFEWNGTTFRLGASIGLVQVNEDHDDVSAILKSADIARYTAKDQGGNQVHVYTEDDHISTTRLKELETVNRIKKALLEDQLVLFSQRIIPIHDNLPEFSEILVRMLDDNQQILTPGNFLPIAEQYNLMSNIDLWVVRKTCDYIKKNPRQNNCFSINLSGATLSKHDCTEELIRIINNSGISPQLIIFEVTETSTISNLDSAVNFMHEIKQLGCRFALDDFGSGLSSFTYLKQMPVDFLKIDGSFIHKLQPETIDFTFVQSIHAIAKTMDIVTVAEWVEDKTVLDYLRVIGIDYVQGNYMDPASPLASRPV